jgi:bla regulator protein blaR1
MTFLANWNENWTAALINHLWQSTVVVAIAWLLTLALRKNQARVRYWVWMAASVKFLLPFSLLMAGGEFARTLVPAASVARPSVAKVMEQIAEPFPREKIFNAVPATAVVHHGVLSGMNGRLAALLTMWACGALFVAIRFARGWWEVRSAMCVSLPLALAAEVPVLSSPSPIEPGIFGILRPVLLMPQGILERLSPEQLRAIVVHETCHLRRRDNLTYALHMIVEALIWFHPAVWWIGARLVEERERACDEAVVAAGGEAQTYAERILNVCKFYVESPVACVSGVTGADLKKRIARILAGQMQCRLTWRARLMVGGVALTGVIVPMTIGLAQSAGEMPDWQKAAGGKMAFDVASVRQDTSSGEPYSNFPLGPGAMYSSNGGTFTARGYPLWYYIFFAYKMTPHEVGALRSQLPPWASSERFDILAKTDKQNATKDEMRLMMQSLLAERFKLSIHLATEQVPVYALEMAKPGQAGPKLRPHPASDKSCSVLLPGAPEAGSPPAPPVAGSYPVTCGGLDDVPASAPGLVAFGYRDVPMGLIALQMPVVGRLDRPVVDKTGLVGDYDLAIEFSRQSGSTSPANNLPDATGATPANALGDDAGPDFQHALLEQDGLKLVPQKGEVEVIIVDHVERPTAN